MSVKITVRENITEDGIFLGDWSGVNKAVSAAKYIKKLEAAVTAAFPDADVTVEAIDEPTLSPLVVVGDGYYQERDTMETLEYIVNQAYQDFASWVVEENDGLS